LEELCELSLEFLQALGVTAVNQPVIFHFAAHDVVLKFVAKVLELLMTAFVYNVHSKQRMALEKEISESGLSGTRCLVTFAYDSD
jgi:hypothetical protein